MSVEHTIASVQHMHDFARTVAERVHGGDIVLLRGELGSGKTTFVQGFAYALGVRAQVTSPTFTIVSDYPVENHPSIKRLVHVDLYRLDDKKADTDPATVEALQLASSPDRCTVVEWADRLSSPPPNALSIHFAHGQEEHERIVTVA